MSAQSSTSPTGRNVRLALFSSAHIPGAVRLSREVGWPHRDEDWGLTLSVSRGVAALDGSEVIGTALCSIFGEVAALNMIIVARSHRGFGLGRRLMEAVLPLADGLEQRLIATGEGLPLYEKLGFRPTHRIFQHQGIARAIAPEQAVRTGSRTDLPAFLSADLGASGMDRTHLLGAIAETGTILTTEGGFALLRNFGKGDVLGPVVARNTAAARSLIAEATRRRADRFLRVDLLEAAELSGYAERAGLAHDGEGVAMVRDACPTRSVTDFRTFALVSQAMG